MESKTGEKCSKFCWSRSQVDSTIVADHAILTGTGRVSRKKEHFEGFLKAIREENSAVYGQMVETRDLKRYEEVS